jgi:hypothetical protein
MARGRPPLGDEIVEHLEGSSQAKQRLRIILRTLAGELTIPQACAELEVSDSRFHEMRTELLQHTLGELEPKPIGRPSQTPTPQETLITQLQQQVQALKIDLRAAQIRQELALALPRLAAAPKDQPAGGGKKDRRRHGR